ncbi:DUF500-domain-containing protein [Hypomontagnella submonticulosa]|nr:DUF500-domain-containing protein [Hypomontagnella submonticulosa]
MSAHPSHSPIPGGNPDYYAELTGDSPQTQTHPAQPNPGQQGQYLAPGAPPASNTDSQYFPPPPPGPPPATQHHDHYPPPPGPPPANLDQQYFPPPPPGPPPHHTYPAQGDPNFPPPPSYAESGGAAGITVTDEKPPILPPRPNSALGAQAAVPQFPPPPTDSSGPHAAASGHHQPPTYQPSAHPTAPDQHAQPASASASGKSGFGRKLYEWGIKAGVPINKLTNKLGSEAFWPTTMDKECDKAARILKSFCKDGFYTAASTTPHAPPSPGRTSGSSSGNTSGPTGKPKVLVKIPQSVIANAKGLAIFTTFRTGLHISGAGGSGLVVARLPDGSWSPPAGFLVHTLGAGIMAGLDIYDCVCVLNTPAAVDAFAKPRLSLGGEIAVVAGPIGAGTSVEAALGKGSKPVWSYMKSRGLYGGVQVDGTVVVQRPDANAAFYGVDKIGVDKILKGEVKANTGRTSAAGKKGDELVMWPEGARQLVEVLKAAEGKGADEGVMRELGNHPTPGDLAPAPGQEQQQQQQGAYQQYLDADTKDKVRFT